MNSDFVNLHTHTTYSLMDSLIKPSELFKKTKELGQSAVAVTDHGSLAGAYDALKYSREAGVKLLMGCEFYFVDNFEQTGRLRHIILIAKNAQGYRNLLHLSKSGFDNKIIMFKKVVPRIDWKLLEQYSDGLICTTACGSGILSQLINTRRLNEAREQAVRLKEIFGSSLALEIQPHAMRKVANVYKDYEDQTFTNRQLIKLGDELDIKIVAATDAHYLTPDQHAAHDVLLAIGSGQPITSGNRLKYIPDFHVKTRDEVRNFFETRYPGRGDEFCDNSLYFANMCETPNWIDPKFTNPSGNELPQFPVIDQSDYKVFKEWQTKQPEKIQTLEDDVAYLRYWCDREFTNRLPYITTDEKIKEYRDRLEEEFSVIEYHGFSSYMLIVADYIDYCRKNNIAVGVGRGSVGGALLAYLIGIHQADPIKYELIFARFHNKEKTSYPDVDTDFESRGKQIVQEYIRKKYGDEQFAHVSNVMTMKPKGYAKDIARVFQYGGDPKAAVAIGNSLSETIPQEIVSVSEALTSAPLFMEYAAQPKYKELKLYAKDLDGKAKAWSTHAGGIVIGKRPLIDIIPLRRDKDGEIAIEYEKERVEANGLVKMDILGVSTLDIIKNTYKIIKEVGKTPPPENLDYDANDFKTYELISAGDTFCVFQLGTSGGTIDLCRKVQPKCIEDLAKITALARPQAKEIRQPFIDAKISGEKVELMHPSLERAFSSTYGFPLYEECLMYVGQDVAGWDLNQADRLRKLTKDKGKHPEKVAQWRLDFIEDAVNNKSIDREVVTKIWDEIISKFGGYAFNHSHAIFYSFISYHTAYLKAHFPLEFLTANLMEEVKSNAKDADDNINKIKNEIRRMKINIIPPDINKSEMTYKIINANTLMTGLDSLKDIGKDAIPEILAKRPFTSFEDFLSRIDGKKVLAPAIQALAASGCLDSFGMTRKLMYLYAADYKSKLQVWKKKIKKEVSFDYPWPIDNDDWTIPQKYAMEREYLGEGLSGDKFQVYAGFFNKSAPKFASFSSQFPDPGDSDTHFPMSVFQAEVKGFFEFKVKKENSASFGKPMGKVLLEDPWGTAMMMTVFPKQWAQFKGRIKALTNNKGELDSGLALFARGSLNWYGGDISIIFEDLLKCTLPPPMPSDLESKKISMRGRKHKVKDLLDKNFDQILEMIEDEMIEEGFSQKDEDFTFLDEDDKDGFN